MSIIGKTTSCLLKLLPNKWRQNIREEIFIRHGMYKRVGYYDEIYAESLQKAFDTYLTEEERHNPELIKKLTRDMVHCWFTLYALPYEYFLYDFRHKTDAERYEFETDNERLDCLTKTIDIHTYSTEISDKYNFYLLTKNYFKREAIKIASKEDFDNFKQFVKKHNIVFIKPLLLSKGQGIFCLNSPDEQQLKEAFDKMMADENQEWIVEEKIIQHPEMASWNESSVNTIRIPSFLKDDKITIIWTRMRMGHRGQIIDNAGAGGILTTVDPVTGILLEDGADEAGKHYEKHPDSGITFKGWQVPQWQELLDTVEELHKTVFPHHRYVAWDFALTTNGWAVVEANWGQVMGVQASTGKGVRKQFHELCGIEYHNPFIK